MRIDRAFIFVLLAKTFYAIDKNVELIPDEGVHRTSPEPNTGIFGNDEKRDTTVAPLEGPGNNYVNNSQPSEHDTAQNDSYIEGMYIKHQKRYYTSN